MLFSELQLNYVKSDIFTFLYKLIAKLYDLNDILCDNFEKEF